MRTKQRIDRISNDPTANYLILVTFVEGPDIKAPHKKWGKKLLFEICFVSHHNTRILMLTQANL